MMASGSPFDGYNFTTQEGDTIINNPELSPELRLLQPNPGISKTSLELGTEDKEERDGEQAIQLIQQATPLVTPPSPLSPVPPSDQHNKGQESPLGKRRSIFSVTRSSSLASWRWELFTWAIGSLSLVAIMVLLASFNNKPQVDWHSRLSLNTIIAALSQTVQSSLLVSLSSCMGQLKWTWFKEEMPLVDLEYFDDASRGPWGGFKLMLKHPLSHVSIGAITTILLLTFSTFIQQAVRTNAIHWYNSSTSATIPIATVYNMTRDFVYIEEGLLIPRNIETAIESMASGEISTPASVTGSCSTANCTWEYTSLAICSSVEDGIDLLRNDLTNCSDPSGVCYHLESLPGTTFLHTADATINSTDTLWGLNDSYSNPASFWIGVSSINELKNFSRNGTTLANFAQIYFIYSTFGGFDANNTANPENFGALVGELQFCLQTYETKLANATFNTALLHQETNLTWVHHAVSQIEDLDYAVTCTQLPGDTVQYCLDPVTTSHLAMYLGQELPGSVFMSWNQSIGLGTASNLYGVEGDSQTIVYNIAWELYHGGPRPFDSKFALERAESLFGNLANSMTNAIRTGPNSMLSYGTAWASEPVININFFFLMFPLALYLTATLFLFTTIYLVKQNSVPLWKSSPLVLLQCTNIGSEVDTKAMDQQARRTSAKLIQVDSNIWRLAEQGI